MRTMSNFRSVNEKTFLHSSSQRPLCDIKRTVSNNIKWQKLAVSQDEVNEWQLKSNPVAWWPQKCLQAVILDYSRPFLQVIARSHLEKRDLNFIDPVSTVHQMWSNIVIILSYMSVGICVGAFYGPSRQGWMN